MDIKLDSNQSVNSDNNLKVIGTESKFLEDIPLHDISRVFTKFNNENRITIIPIGFPGAGKSLFLSSLFRYARNGTDPLFSISLENNFPYEKGRQVVDQMITYFDSGKIYEATRKGTLDLIGLKLIPTHAELPEVNFGFLDLAGEDIEKIKTSNNGDFTKKINAVFNGLKIHNSPIIFTLITPFAPPKKSESSEDQEHRDEDALHADFLNYLSQEQPDIYNNCKFFVIVSQWDKNRNPNLTIEEFMYNNRPAVHGLIKNKNVVWGQYSIGKLLETTDEQNRVFQELVDINSDYPQRLWNKIYKICTTKELNKKTFWEKLFHI